MIRFGKKYITTKIPGSLTVETALVLPIFMYAIIAFIYFLQIIGIHEDIQCAITETGYYTAKYAYVYDYILHYDESSKEEQINEDKEIGYKENDNKEIEYKENDFEASIDTIIASSINSAYYKLKMRDYVKEERLNQSCIHGGYEGINTYLSTFMKDSNCVDIIVIYRIKLPLIFFNLDSFPVIQRVRMHGWNGYGVTPKNSNSDNQEKSLTVYITEHGTVYHLSKECTHLTLSIQEINFYQLELYRNNSGGKYKECSLCDKYVTNSHEKVFITKTGDRYHYSLTCSGLKRNIITIPINNIGERNLCRRCGKSKE